VFQFYFSLLGVGMGEGFEYKIQFIEKIPIPPITKENQSIVSQIESLVDKILAAKKENPHANTIELEKQVDHLVYGLYELTEEEIRIVEGK
ncbi:MAG: class I SAM-dependent DNA methyltransferase, partial [Chloroherpetonaceae bacterium]